MMQSGPDPLWPESVNRPSLSLYPVSTSHQNLFPKPKSLPHRDPTLRNPTSRRPLQNVNLATKSYVTNQTFRFSAARDNSHLSPLLSTMTESERVVGACAVSVTVVKRSSQLSG